MSPPRDPVRTTRVLLIDNRDFTSDERALLTEGAGPLERSPECRYRALDKMRVAAQDSVISDGHEPVVCGVGTIA